MTSRKKPGVALWATVVMVGLLVVYVVSLGPMAWLAGRFAASGEAMPQWLWSPVETALHWYFAPFMFVATHSPEPVARAMVAYLRAWT